MDTLILTRAHYRRRYGNDAPEMSIPSRFLEEVPNQLVESLGGRPAWGSSAYSSGRRTGGQRGHGGSDFEGEQHYNYEDESQEAYNPAAARSKSGESKPFVASWMTAKTPAAKQAAGAGKPPDSLDNIARFFGGKAGAVTRPKMDIPETHGAHGLKKGQRVKHSKYGEGTVLMREGEGEDAKLTVMFNRHGMKKLMEKFANLEKI
jgi:DNA helicase-2/ATP-dependent DNA helicase PcrA